MIPGPVSECARCPAGAATGRRPGYEDTPAGRAAHRAVFGHNPAPLPPEVEEDASCAI